jgi:hypothetical protein
MESIDYEHEQEHDKAGTTSRASALRTQKRPLYTRGHLGEMSLPDTGGRQGRSGAAAPPLPPCIIERFRDIGGIRRAAQVRSSSRGVAGSAFGKLNQ